MGFLDRLAAGAEFRATSTLRNPSGDLVDAIGGGGRAQYSGERVTVNNALGLSAVYSAVTLISEQVGGLPFKVYRTLDDDERVEARTHRMWRILNQKPNPYTDRKRFWATVMNHLLLWGNAFIPKERDDLGIVESLWIEDPSGMTVEWNGREKTFYRETDGRRKRWTTENMLHIFGPSLDGLTGMSPIGMCREGLGTAIARAKFEGGFYRRGARSPAVIEHPGRLGERGTKNLSQTFKAWHGGVDNMHQVPVLEEGATLKSLSMPLEDLQFVESQQLSRTDVASMFWLPPSYIGGSTGDSLTYATIESNSIQLQSITVAPWTDTIAGAVNTDPALFPQDAVYAEHVLEALHKADIKARAEWWKTLKELGVVDAEYIAARENLPTPPEPPKQEPPAPSPDSTDENGNGQMPVEMQRMQDLVRASRN